MPATDNLGGADAFQAAHRSRSGLQPTVIGFNRVVGVLLHDVPRLGHELVEHPRVRRGGSVVTSVGRRAAFRARAKNLDGRTAHLPIPAATGQANSPNGSC